MRVDPLSCAAMVIGLFVVSVIGCSRFEEAYRERVGDRAPVVRLKCPVRPALVERWNAPRLRLSARNAPIAGGIDSPFDWAAVPSAEIPVTLEPSSSARVFSGEKRIGVTHFHASDTESALQQAYCCLALAEFAALVNTRARRAVAVQ